MNKLVVLPIGDIILFTENGLNIGGKDLDQEQLLNFKDGCSVLKENFARKVIHEQIRYKATEMGIHKSQSLDELMFAKAALWVLNEYEILIHKLSEL